MTSILTKTTTQECFNGGRDHTGTHSHTGKHEYHPGTQNW